MVLEKFVQDVQGACATAETAPSRWKEVQKFFSSADVNEHLKSHPNEHDAALQVG